MASQHEDRSDTQVIFSQPVPHPVLSPPPSELRDYPRPDYYHSPLIWSSLNGPWDFCFDDEDVGLQQQWHSSGIPENHPGRRTIQVPFVFQSRSSWLAESGVHETLWYQRLILDPRDDGAQDRGERVLVRFGAVDYEATVWLDGQFVGVHCGGHVPFDVDVTDVLSGDNGDNPNGDEHRLTVRVFDSATDVTQPRGKQFWGPEPHGIWYPPLSGIWQSVWVEVVPAVHIGDSSQGTILRSDGVEAGELDALIAVQGRQAGRKYFVDIESRFAGSMVRSSGRVEMPGTKRFAVKLDMRLSREHFEGLPDELIRASPTDDEACWLNGVALWSPEHPLLYDIIIRLFDAEGRVLDEVKTSTGMRMISWNHGDGTLRLNGQPYFHALVLDQGYWKNSLMTPPDSTRCRTDIELAKATGFNGCRKHQKVEDPLYLYWADRLGFMVWGEMASAHKFSQDYVNRFDREWMEMVRRDLNHPCVVTWTLANESWGYGELGTNVEQRNHLRSLYYRTKTLDPTRPINDNSGWQHVKTDLSTFHEYADDQAMRDRCKSVNDILTNGQVMFVPALDNDDGAAHKNGAPILCTEFGGVNIAPISKDGQHSDGWGYTTASDGEDLLGRIEKLCLAVTDAGHICGFVWTQLTDIEQETNGLYTYDRKEKLPADSVKNVIEEAAEAYLRQHATTARSIGLVGSLDKCRNVRLDGVSLIADCALDGNGKRWRESRVDLNDCLTNSFGKLAWSKGGNFGASARNCRLVDEGLVFEAEANDGQGWVHNRIPLNEKIRNNKGALEVLW